MDFDNTSDDDLPSTPSGKDLIIIVYVHGFKGTDVTFEEFPDRIKHLVQATLPRVKVQSEVFPVYETKGDLNHAVERFVDWLTELTVHAEVGQGEGGGAGKVKIVLCGHSMGGLLIADSVLRMQAHKHDPSELLWPRVIAVIAFDTPYLGLHPHVFKNGITKYTSHIETARTVLTTVFGTTTESNTSSTASSRAATPPKAEPSPSSSSFFSLPTRQSLLKGSAVVLGGAAAAGAAYWRKDDIQFGWKWVSDHAVFVRNLWDDVGMRTRLEGLAGMVKQGQRDGIVYRNFYTHLPPTPPDHVLKRTFCLLPPQSHPLWPFWKPVTYDTKKTEDEVACHLGMFNPRTNLSFYEMGLDVVNAIAEAVGVVDEEEDQDVEMD